MILWKICFWSKVFIVISHYRSILQLFIMIKLLLQVIHDLG